jgi:thiol-disulfide isomerase/thioredoxin
MKILILFILSLTTSCEKNSSLNKRWLMDIDLQGQSLKAIVDLKKDQGILYNSTEEIKLTKIKNGYQIGANYSHLEFNQDHGFWVRDNKEDYRIKFQLTPIETTDLFKKYEQKTCETKFAKKWKIKLSEENTGLGTFKQNGCRIQGSILTTTGDYRFLDGYIQNKKIHLQGFDGVFAFVFKLKLKDDALKGDMYAGKSHHKEISGVPDDKFSLAFAGSMTQIIKSKKLTTQYTDIDGHKIDLNQGKYQNTPKIIQLFGSWCPNCLDETKFFNQWRLNNPLKKIHFISLAFENFKTKKEALKALKKSRDKLNMQYPLVLVDYDKSVKASDILPIDKVRAFPTTLYVDKNNNVIKTHTGFSGQATGEYFNSFIEDFNNMTDLLINE